MYQTKQVYSILLYMKLSHYRHIDTHIYILLMLDVTIILYMYCIYYLGGMTDYNSPPLSAASVDATL